MATTARFALRTFPEFKDAAKSLVGLHIYESHMRDGKNYSSAIRTDSINSALNSLIAKGIPSMLDILDSELSTQQSALEIAQEIMRFLLNNPAAQRAYAVNFAGGSGARRLLEALDAGRREAEENEGGINDAVAGLSDSEMLMFGTVIQSTSEDGISQPTAAEALARIQGHLEMPPRRGRCSGRWRAGRGRRGTAPAGT